MRTRAFNRIFNARTKFNGAGLDDCVRGKELTFTGKGAIQVLRNARGGGGGVYAQALRSVTRGWGGIYASVP